MNRFAFVALLLSSIPYVFGSDEGEQEKDNNMLWAAHGICASIAWAILVPLAIGSAMLRKELVKAGFSESFWFQLHRALNLTAAILTIISFAISVHIIREEDGKSPWKEDTHFIVGLVIFIVTLLQATFALFRPHLPHKEEKKESVKNLDEEETVAEAKDVENKVESMDKESKNAAVGETTEEEEAKETEIVGKKSLLRKSWEVNHRFFGVGLLATAWWELHSGWELYEVKEGGENLGAIFLGVAGGISGIIAIVYAVQKMRAKA
jgi:preprotein translocase subunit YajC